MGKKNMNQIKKTDFYFDDKIMDYHFLFNSLETINCLALSIGASEICKVTLALANMFRFVINDNQATVLLKDEIDFTNEYLTIQAVRYNENLTFEIDSSHIMLTVMCPRFLIQSIVNRMIHYYIEKKDLVSHIKIAIEPKSNSVVVTIRNNLKDLQRNLLGKKEEELLKEEILDIGKSSQADKNYDIKIINCDKTGITVKLELYSIF
ncbi:MAG: histidine kinase [Epulopiscium sp.]|nr:histidine kinase [Candidatus Epulonipiscium sp.]HOQ16405.1 histidine kinase [Defluviitaleaceae bacterium]